MSLNVGYRTPCNTVIFPKNKDIGVKVKCNWWDPDGDIQMTEVK